MTALQHVALPLILALLALAFTWSAVPVRRRLDDADEIERGSTEIVIGRFDGALGLEGSPAGARQNEEGYGETRTRSNSSSTSNSSNAGYGRPSGNSGGARPISEQIDDDIPF